MIETAIPPYLAPLSIPMIEFLDRRYEGTSASPKTFLTLQDYLQDAKNVFHSKWFYLAQQVINKQPQLHEVMKSGIQQGDVSPGWFLETLSRLTPNKTDKFYSRQTLARWRDAGLIQYHERQRITGDSSAAMLTLRLLDGDNEYGWHPGQVKPSPWHCWRQDSPDSPIVSCPANPLPSMPKKSFLFTTYLAASLLDPAWMPFANVLSVRWYGTVVEEGRFMWDLSDEDLQSWDNNEVTRFGMKISSKAARLNRHTQASMILLKLASDVLSSSLSLSSLLSE